VIRRATLAVVLLAAASLVPDPAAAANKDLERLQLQIATLQSQLLDIQRAADDTRKECRRLADLIAEQNALLQRTTADRRQQDEAMTTSFKDLYDRIGELVEAIQGLKTSGMVALPAPGLGTSSSAPGASGASGTATEPASPAAPPPAPRELYSQAYADFARGNYDLAIQGFSEYIRNYPGTDFTDNAQYWVGECLYGKKMYAEAIEAWNVLFRDYASSDKLPDARVKKGMALERLGRRSQALVEYRYVVDRFPNSQAARIARERLNP
jgi:tol-pal system protein YbgF